MAKKKQRGNGDGDVWPRRNKEGKITGYRGSYFGPHGKRRYVSGKTKEGTRSKLRSARADADRGQVFDSPDLKVGAYLTRWLNDSVKGSVKPITHDSYRRFVNKHAIPAIIRRAAGQGHQDREEPPHRDALRNGPRRPQEPPHTAVGGDRPCRLHVTGKRPRSRHRDRDAAQPPQPHAALVQAAA